MTQGQHYGTIYQTRNKVIQIDEIKAILPIFPYCSHQAQTLMFTNHMDNPRIQYKNASFIISTNFNKNAMQLMRPDNTQYCEYAMSNLFSREVIYFLDK